MRIDWNGEDCARGRREALLVSADVQVSRLKLRAVPGTVVARMLVKLISVLHYRLLSCLYCMFWECMSDSMSYLPFISRLQNSESAC